LFLLVVALFKYVIKVSTLGKCNLKEVTVLLLT